MKLARAEAAPPKTLATLLAETIDFGLMVRQVRWTVMDEDPWLVGRLSELERQANGWADRIATHMKSIGCRPDTTTLYVFQWSRLPDYPLHCGDQASPVACLDAALEDLHRLSVETRPSGRVFVQLSDEVEEARRRLTPKIEPDRESGDRSARVLPLQRFNR